MATKRRPPAPRPRHPAPARINLSSIITARSGRSQSVADYIAEQIDAGVIPEHAAMTAGLTAAEFRAILRDGTAALARYSGGADWARDLTPDEQDAAVFANRVQRATGDWASRMQTAAELIARGGAVTETVRIRRDRQGNELERVVTRETAGPNADMIRWRLERMFPREFGARAQVDMTVLDLTDGTDVREQIVARLSEIAERMGATPALPIETTATDTTPGADDGPSG